MNQDKNKKKDSSKPKPGVPLRPKDKGNATAKPGVPLRPKDKGN